MNRTIVLATIKHDTNMQEMFAVVREEIAQVELLRSEKRVGAVYLSQSRRTVFIEVFAESDAEVRATIATLPMARWWVLDLFPVSEPPAADRS